MVRPKTFVPLTILTFVEVVKLSPEVFPLKRTLTIACPGPCSPIYSPIKNQQIRLLSEGSTALEFIFRCSSWDLYFAPMFAEFPRGILPRVS